MRQTIYTETYHFLIGAGAVSEFYKAMGWYNNTSIDSYGIITQEMIDKLKTMQPQEFGFTEEYKKEWLDRFEIEKGKYYLITDDWYPDDDRKRMVKHFLQKLGETNDFQKAKELTNTYLTKE